VSLSNKQVFPSLSIAIPASLVSDVPHLREKSLKIGLVSRAASIFCVDEIVIFSDLPGVDQKKDINLIKTILSYMETPQYLRKRLFKIKPELRYAGILPPLRTPHHPISNQTRGLSIGEHREGAVISKVKHGSLVDIGVEKLVLIPKSQLPINSRVTVKVTELGKHPKAALANREEVKTYWGYRITVSKNLFGRFLKKHNFDLVIATSRQGDPIQKLEDILFKRWKKSRRILVAFGAPIQGLYEIAIKENLELSNVADFVINTIPHQGTETVRTEEAIYASLAIFNLFTKDIKRNHSK